MRNGSASLIAIACLAPSLDGAWATTAETWGYRIGQETAPAVRIQETADRFVVYPNHPRLFFRDTDLPAIRQRIRSTHVEDWNWLHALAGRMLKRDPSRWARKPKGWFPARAVTFVAAVTGEQKYHDWAKRWADLMVKIGPQKGPDDNYRGRLMGLAIVYDWLYERLSDAERKRYGDSIEAHVKRNWYFAERPQFSGGHSRWGNFALATGLLAVVTERHALREKLLRVRQNWLEGYHPLQGWIAVDGGYHMGWTYGSSYTKVRNHVVWSSATNESVYYPWRGKLPYFWIYGRQGDGTYPLSGDAFNWGGLSWGTLVTAAGVLKNRHATWFLRDLIKRSAYRDRFWNILFEDKSVRPLAPDDPQAPLPLSRHFRNAGYVLFRDRWDKETTLLSFKSSSFTSANHHHRDQNAFTLHYRGRLAIDSGSYQKGSSYGTSHWQNYFVRTIAHNTVTVFDPKESFGTNRRAGGARSNDGGQAWKRDWKNLKDLLPGGPASLAGVTGYAEEGDYAFARGDASRAYSEKKLKRFVRTVVYLRKPAGRRQPLVVVHDHVISTKPEFTKRFLLHSVGEPKLSGGHLEIVAGGGRLQAVTVLPADAKISKVGGPGRQFWAGGKNYGLKGLSGKKLREALDWAGEWRVEVSPARPAREDHFLHVLAVSPRESTAPPPECARVEEGPFKGVVVCGHAVLFGPTDRVVASGRYNLPGQGAGIHIIVGVKPASPYTVRAHSGHVVAAKSTAGGSVRFRMPPGARGPFALRPGTVRKKAHRPRVSPRARAALPFRREKDVPTPKQDASQLRHAIIDGLKAGRHAAVYVPVGGRLTRARLLAADERGVTVATAGVQVAVPWSAFSLHRLIQMASAITPPAP